MINKSNESPLRGNIAQLLVGLHHFETPNNVADPNLIIFNRTAAVIADQCVRGQHPDEEFLRWQQARISLQPNLQAVEKAFRELMIAVWDPDTIHKVTHSVPR